MKIQPEQISSKRGKLGVRSVPYGLMFRVFPVVLVTMIVLSFAGIHLRTETPK